MEIRSRFLMFQDFETETLKLTDFPQTSNISAKVLLQAVAVCMRGTQTTNFTVLDRVISGQPGDR